jgi:hypothetical protein
MKTGRITLDTLYEHALSDPRGSSIKGNSATGREYGRKASELTKYIPASHGFYLWGKYEKNRLWRTIYLGKAGYGKTTSLQARIKEELKDERVFLWCGPHSNLNKEDLMKIGKKYYPTMWHKYKTHFARAFLKSGSTHIIWAVPSGISVNEVTKIEADLIETMNPIANKQRPVPVSDLQNKTIEIIKMFKHRIHKCRNEVVAL